MPGTQSKASLKRQEKRLGAEMQMFKQQILAFLQDTNADSNIQYHMVKDLAKMTSMPFYGDSNRGTRNKMPSNDVVKAYSRLLVCYFKMTEDLEFVEKLLSWLSRQQQQHLRRLSRLPAAQKSKRAVAIKAGQCGVYEHPIPVNYTKKLLLKYIEEGDQKSIDGYIDFIYNHTYQVFLESTWDNQVNLLYKDTMPDAWNWMDPENNNVFARYISASIPTWVYRQY